MLAYILSCADRMLETTEKRGKKKHDKNERED